MFSFDKAGSKRRRAEHQDSGSSERSECRYDGCRRPTLDKGRGILHAFCNLTHRDFFMAHLADLFSHGESYETGNEMHKDRCKLPGCEERKTVDTGGYEFDFCRKRHALCYIEDCTREWAREDRLCQFQLCTHHVCVDESTRTCYKFCSFQHAKLAAAAKGAQTIMTDSFKSVAGEGKTSGSNEDPQRSLSQETSRDSQATERLRGHHPKIQETDLETCLKAAFLHSPRGSADADPREKFTVGVNIFKFHPWDLVNELRRFVPRYFVYIRDSKDINHRGTKDGFGWKQTSKTHKLKSGEQPLETTYFCYELKERDSKNDCLGDHVKAYRQYHDAPRVRSRTTRWKMHEIVLPELILEEMMKENPEVPRRQPVIWKIFQNRKGEPVWPRLVHNEDRQLSRDECQLATMTSVAKVSDKSIIGEQHSNGISDLSSPTFSDEHLLPRLEIPSKECSRGENSPTGMEDSRPISIADSGQSAYVLQGSSQIEDPDSQLLEDSRSITIPNSSPSSAYVLDSISQTEDHSSLVLSGHSGDLDQFFDASPLHLLNRDADENILDRYDFSQFALWPNEQPLESLWAPT